MNLVRRRSKAQTWKDRTRATGAAASDLASAAEDLAKAVGEIAEEASRTARDRVDSVTRDLPDQLESGRSRALAVVGVAVAGAAVFVVWRARKGDSRPSVHSDPAQPLGQDSPVAQPPPQRDTKPHGDKLTEAPGSSTSKSDAPGAKKAADDAAGTRSK